ncbi:MULTISPECIES: hypothetical protein [unclassified Streptomyces]|uniref:hypothetical protein n=1 Tax=Streptomyces TaxID=1883 RepID=UPI00096B40BE|nr:hypothetical protein [Streptomyces sp. FR-008]KAF0794746.1 hypothetical protein P405_17735 [Streptomyces sp. FR-008]MYX50650.1 hypothetical protein [Streptomyces sp. SID8385]
MAHMEMDDELYEVDSVYLGPRGLTLLWRARYQAYGVGVLLTIALLAMLKVVGLSGFWPIAFGMIGVIWATREIGKKITHEKGVREFLVEFVAEIRTPRPVPVPAPVTTAPALRIRRRACP